MKVRAAMLLAALLALASPTFGAPLCRTHGETRRARAADDPAHRNRAPWGVLIGKPR